MTARFLPVAEGELRAAVDAIKKRNAGRVLLTNHFLQPLDKLANLRMAASESSVCFLHDELDFSRAYFYGFDPKEIAGLAESVEWPPIVVADWPSKGLPAIHSHLTLLGFHVHTIYDRIVCPALRAERAYDPLCLAGAADREALALLMLRVFDKYADHIVSVEELAELIAHKQVVLSRGAEKQINGVVVFRVASQKCNFNFLYSGGSPLDLARLLGNFYGILTDRGVRSGFGWVRRTRPLVLKLHQSFGWRTDGLVNYIYMRS